MTNKTQTAEFRERLNGEFIAFELREITEQAIEALEAAEARIAELEIKQQENIEALIDATYSCEAWKLRAEKAEAELAALHGAAVVPVAYFCRGRHDAKYTGTIIDAADRLIYEINGGYYFDPLFTHPAPPVAIRCEHAEWSQATFGNVGPTGPLKHLSKEAIEAAEAPDDLSEWADMQFLFWDAQRRAGITDAQIEQAMVDKLAINKTRDWPEPKDGEPRLHVKSADGEVQDDN